jgi:hypothetical protein
MAVTRPLKEGSVTTYQQKVALGFPDILASEVDADLDTIYAAWNGGIADGSVTPAKLAAGAVGTRELADNGITAPKLTVDCVNSLAIAAGAVGTSELGDSTITAPKLTPNCVSGPAIADASIGWAKLGERAYARVWRAAPPALVHNTNTVFSFDQVDSNVGGLFSIGAPDHFTIQQTGLYLIGAGLGFPGSTGGVRREVWIDAGFYAANENRAPSTQTANVTLVVILALNAGALVKLWAYQDSGGPLTPLTSGAASPNFWILRVG